MNILDSKFNYPEPIKTLNMDKLNEYLQSHQSVIKSPHQIAGKSHEVFPMNVQETKFGIERYVDLGHINITPSKNPLNMGQRQSICKILTENIELLTCSLYTVPELDLKKHLSLLVGILPILSELSLNDYDFVSSSPVYMKLAQDNCDLGLIIFKIVSYLFHNQTVCVICYNPQLCLSLHILSTILNPVCKENLLIVFDKFSCNELLRDPSSVAIVYTDADILNSAQYVIDSHLHYNGKSSMRTSLVLVQQSILSKFESQLIDLISKLNDDLNLPTINDLEKESLRKMNCEAIKDGSIFYEAPANVIDLLDAKSKHSSTLLIPFRTAKESLTILKAFANKQNLYTDCIRNYTQCNQSLNLFSFNSNALWQLISLIEGFNSIFINGDFLPSYNTALKLLDQRFHLNPIQGGSLALHPKEDRSISEIISKLDTNVKSWFKLSFRERIQKLEAAFAIKLDLEQAFSNLSMDECNQNRSTELCNKLKILLSMKQFKNNFGIIYLDQIEDQNTLIQGLAAGNGFLISKDTKQLKIPDAFKDLVLVSDLKPEALQSYKVAICDCLAAKPNLTYFQSNLDVFTPIGQELFAN